MDTQPRLAVLRGGHEVLEIRPIRPQDVEETAKLCMETFNAFNATVGLPAEFPTLCSARDVIAVRAQPESRYTCFVAVTREGRIVGTNAISLAEDTHTAAAVGPLAVAPDFSDRTLGRRLMEAVIDAGRDRGKSCIMLQQVANNTKSFCLYLKLGFRPIENCLYLQGHVDSRLAFPSGKYRLRRMVCEDAAACDALFRAAVPGFSRHADILTCITRERDRAGAGQFVLYERCGEGEELAGYITSVSLAGHVLARNFEAFTALLIGVSQSLKAHGVPLSLHLPSRLYPEVAGWAVGEAGLRLIRQSTLMALGEGPVPMVPAGSRFIYCPSIEY